MELLKKLYQISSKSNHEEDMLEFLKEYLTNNFPSAIVEEDKRKNLYVTKGISDSYPVIVSHVDEVHLANENKVIIHQNDHIFGYDFTKHCPTGIGADDKNGIWICLKALEKYDVIKLAFFVGEEIGCVGSRDADMSFFDNARFVLQCDRKGNNDFINSAGSTKLCTSEFISKIGIKDYGYHEASGLMTDVKTLREKGLTVCSCNLSCGYYNPHKDDECTNVPDLLKCWDLVQHIVETITTVQTFPEEKKFVQLGTCKSSYSNWYKREEEIELLTFLISDDYYSENMTPYEMYETYRSMFKHLTLSDFINAKHNANIRFNS